MENRITTYGYVFSHTHVTKNDICSAVLVLYCCSQSECSPVLFKYLDRFLTKWHRIVYRWKATVNVYLMRLFPRLSAIKWKSYIQNTTFSELLSQISLLFTYQMVCYYMPLESPFWCLSSGTNLIFPRLEMQKLYSKYYIFRTYFSNILVVFLSNNILLYTVGKLVLIPIQWCYSHISMVRNTKVIFKIHHFFVFNSLTFVFTRAPTQI